MYKLYEFMGIWKKIMKEFTFLNITMHKESLPLEIYLNNSTF